MITEVNRHVEGYRFDLATQALYEFTWHEFCDWYLELTKPILNGAYSEEEKAATRYNLLSVLDSVLKALHPFMPYITEEIWQKLTEIAPSLKTEVSISVEQFPVAPQRDTALEAEVEWLQEVLLAVRRIRGEMNISPGKPLDVLYENASENDLLLIEKNMPFLQRMGRLESFTKVEGEAPESAVVVIGKMRLLIPLAGLIDKEQELARLNREIGKIEPTIKMLTGKLSNPGFTDKAPAQVVEGERVKLSDAENQLKELKQQLIKIQSL